MLMWSIVRTGDGPLKAYKHIGQELSSTPTKMNQTLSSMASAIVRNRIANSTINTILKERTVIRDALRAEMAKTCEGWGIWLETIEITDVKIMSSTLFAHMQTQFSEQ